MAESTSPQCSLGIGIDTGGTYMERLVDLVAEFKGQVDAYAVCSEMSIVNPVHEQVAAKAIGLMDSKPVFCSHRVSIKPGLKERCATAVLHARLMPVIGDFIDHTRRQLQVRGLTAKVLMVRGDASALPIDGVEHEAAATVASGPAASVFYVHRRHPGVPFREAKRRCALRQRPDAFDE
jgi:N-methylhydantoinase A/oxoprolinase/acetone carboxylase beta subunit